MSLESYCELPEREMTEKIEKSLLELDFASLTRRTSTPSPAAWEDQVLYFLLLDRFSDGKERDGYRDKEDQSVRTGATPVYRPEDLDRVDYDAWFRAGGGWQGGTLAGLKSKLGYLRRLGITALWVSPIFRLGPHPPSTETVSFTRASFVARCGCPSPRSARAGSWQHLLPKNLIISRARPSWQFWRRS